MEKPESLTKPVEGSVRLDNGDVSHSGREGEAERPEFMVRVGKAVYQLPAIQQWDLNGDGVITEEELAAAAVSHGRLQSAAVNYRRMSLGLLLLLIVSVGVMIASVVIGTSRQPPRHYVTFYVPAQDAVLSFKVEEVRRNATMLSLISSAASTLYISESEATLADSQGQRFLVEGSAEPGGGARRRLLKKKKKNDQNDQDDQNDQSSHSFGVIDPLHQAATSWG
eukprot:jgi/Mesen1/4388/ME000223S03457